MERNGQNRAGPFVVDRYVAEHAGVALRLALHQLMWEALTGFALTLALAPNLRRHLGFGPEGKGDEKRIQAFFSGPQKARMGSPRHLGPKRKSGGAIDTWTAVTFADRAGELRPVVAKAKAVLRHGTKRSAAERKKEAVESLAWPVWLTAELREQLLEELKESPRAEPAMLARRYAAVWLLGADYGDRVLIEIQRRARDVPEKIARAIRTGGVVTF